MKIEEWCGISTDMVLGLVIGLILGLVSYPLILENGGGTGGGGEELTVDYFGYVDHTKVLGPGGEDLVGLPSEINLSPPPGDKISPGEEVTYSGEIQWKGGENENMSTYGKGKLEIHLLLTKESNTEKLNVLIIVGDYSGGMAPQPPGGEYVNHDTTTVQEFGGSKVSPDFNLSATYLEG